MNKSLEHKKLLKKLQQPLKVIMMMKNYNEICLHQIQMVNEILFVNKAISLLCN